MSELIERQAAIDLFPNDVLEWDTLNGYIAPHVARRLIEQLPPAQPEPQWIPVSERLPEKGGEYFVSVRWYREDDIDINVCDYDARCKKWNDGESCGQRVIAWMPLPEPYKPNKKQSGKEGA